MTSTSVIRPRTPRLSVALIVRDEARRLPGCLDALAGLADEIVVVDTGSADDTLDIARHRGCVVASFSWCDDFSAARNAALPYCSGAWVLSLDADEKIAQEDHGILRAYVAGTPDCCYRFITRTYCNDGTVGGFVATASGDPHCAGFSGWFPSAKIRLFPNRVGVAFDGVVHELPNRSLEQLGIPVIDTPVPVHHYALLDQQAEERARKQALYLTLGRAKVAAHPADPRGFHELGDQCVDMGRFGEALDAYRTAVTLEPENPRWLKDLGSALLLLGKFPQAIQALTLSARLGPEDAECWRNLGVAHVGVRDWEAARVAFERSHALHPDHPECLRYLALAHNGLGDVARAIVLLERLLERYPQHAEARTLFFHLMELQGRGPEAETWLHRRRS